MGVDSNPDTDEPAPPRRRRFLALLAALTLAALLASFVPISAAAAQDDDDGEPADVEDVGEIDEVDDADEAEADPADEGDGLAGRLQVGEDRDPVPGVTLEVFDEAGASLAVVETDDEGEWQLLGLEPGDYVIELDEATLPEGVTLDEGREPTIERTVRAGRTTPVAFRLLGEGGPRREARTFTDTLSQSLLNGVKFGLIIAMASIGLSLIFGTTGLVNFAHGELVTFGAIAAWFLNSRGFHWGPLDLFGPQSIVVAGVLAVILGGLLGGTLDRGIFRPLRQRGTGLFQMLVIAIGLSLALRQAMLIWFGGDSPRYRVPLQAAHVFGPLEITPRDMQVMAVAFVTLLAVGAMLQFSRIGKAMRAVADNQDLAESSGIDVQRVILFVWVLGGSLAALGGVLQGLVGTVNYQDGFRLLLLMFAAVVLGGLGTAFGAAVGGLVIGLATEVSTVWVDSELKFIFGLAILVAVLLIRPQGIFGVRERVG